MVELSGQMSLGILLVDIQPRLQFSITWERIQAQQHWSSRPAAVNCKENNVRALLNPLHGLSPPESNCPRCGQIEKCFIKCQICTYSKSFVPFKCGVVVRRVPRYASSASSRQ